MPEVSVFRVKRCTVLITEFKGKLLAYFLLQESGRYFEFLALLNPPLVNERRWKQGVVVFQKVSEVYEYFTQIKDFIHLIPYCKGFGKAVHSHDVSIPQPHCRPLYRGNGNYASRFSRPLDFQLGSHRYKAIRYNHCCRIYSNGGEARISGSAVSQPETPPAGGVTEHRSPRNYVREVLVFWLYSVFTFAVVFLFFSGVLFSLLYVYQVVEPFPSVYGKTFHEFFQLWGFQSNSFCNYQTHSTSNSVRFNSRQVSVPRHLRIFRRLSVYAHWTVRNDQLYLFISRQVLQVCHFLVEGYFLAVPEYLLFGWFIPRNVQFSPHEISN